MRFLLALVLLAPAAHAQAIPYDLVIRNGHIIDGTGSPWYSGDIAIRGGRIAALGKLDGASAKRTIDARGMVVAPGFIDMLGQSELTILVDPHLPSKIYQGITTEITGEGDSVAPQTDATIQADRVGYEHYHITPDWRTLDQYFQRLQKQGMGINLGTYVGATQVRRVVLGDKDVQPTPAQLEQMGVLVDQAMQQGAMGVSTSLEYAPAPYASTEELIALAKQAAKYGGIYASHIRSDSSSAECEIVLSSSSASFFALRPAASRSFPSSSFRKTYPRSARVSSRVTSSIVIRISSSTPAVFNLRAASRKSVSFSRSVASCLIWIPEIWLKNSRAVFEVPCAGLKMA